MRYFAYNIFNELNLLNQKVSRGTIAISIPFQPLIFFYNSKHTMIFRTSKKNVRFFINLFWCINSFTIFVVK